MRRRTQAKDAGSSSDSAARQAPQPPAAARHHAWWGEETLALGTACRWVIGPMTVWVENRPEGYRLAWIRSGDRRSEELELRQDVEPDETWPPEDATPVLVFDESLAVGALGAHSEGGLSSRADGLRILPMAADRPVVTRPDGSCLVAPERRVHLYVSTPVWLRVEQVGGQVLLDEPTVRLSDTWFGPNTRHGELCYAIRTKPFADLRSMPVLAFRAITRVRIENRGSDALELARIQLPAPNLALWVDDAHPEAGLWTSSVGLVRGADGEIAEVDLVGSAPPELESPRRVAPPRERQTRNVVVRAMSAILG